MVAKQRHDDDHDGDGGGGGGDNDGGGLECRGDSQKYISACDDCLHLGRSCFCPLIDRSSTVNTVNTTSLQNQSTQLLSSVEH